MNAIVSLSHPLIAENGLELNVSRINLERLKHKYTASSEAKMNEVEWDKAELEYRRFLSLKRLYPSIALVPSKQVNSIWHAHILDTRSYRTDCEQVFGRFIDYYPYLGIYGEDDQQELKNAFAETVTLYEKHFGAYPGGGTESQALL